MRPADAASSCVDPAEGAVQHCRSCMSPCCCSSTRAVDSILAEPEAGLWANTAWNVTTSLTGEQGAVFLQTQLILSVLTETAVEKHPAAPLRSCCYFPRQQFITQVGASASFHPLSLWRKLPVITQLAMADLQAALEPTFIYHPYYKPLISSNHSSQLYWDWPDTSTDSPLVVFSWPCL